MKIDAIIQRIRDGEPIVESELFALVDYTDYLEFGYAGLERLDLVALAKQSAGKRLSDHEADRGEEPFDIRDNKIELLAEDIECVHKYLDDMKVARVLDERNLSIVGRFKHHLQKIRSGLTSILDEVQRGRGDPPNLENVARSLIRLSNSVGGD